MNINVFLNKINALIINPLIILVFTLALFIFFYGVFDFIRHADDAKGREDSKKKIVYGLIGMFVMFSAYGLIHLVLSTFGITTPPYIQGR